MTALTASTPTTPNTSTDDASDNAILAISARAAQLRAQGVDVVSLAAGEPDTPTPTAITEAAARAALHGDHHYSPAAGDPALRRAVTTRLPAVTPAFTDDDVQITLGTKHALALGLHAIVDPGDDVLIARPGWPGHTGAVLAAFGRPVTVPVSADTGFLPTAADLDTAHTARTRAVVLAGPANPSGAIFRPDQLTAIADWALARDVWIISDDIYEQFVYDVPQTHPGRRAVPHVLDLVPELRRRCLVVNGVSKAYAMTGWRVGWLAGPPAVLTAARRHVARTITHVPTVTQAAALAALTGDQQPVYNASTRYRRNRDHLTGAFADLPGVHCPTPAGGMFVFPDVTGLLAHGPWDTTVELATWLLDHARVAVVPGEAFGAPGHLRMCFAVTPATLDTAAARLVKHLHRGGRTR